MLHELLMQCIVWAGCGRVKYEVSYLGSELGRERCNDVVETGFLLCDPPSGELCLYFGKPQVRVSGPKQGKLEVHRRNPGGLAALAASTIPLATGSMDMMVALLVWLLVVITKCGFT